jgi:hypothetical protein
MRRLLFAAALLTMPVTVLTLTPVTSAIAATTISKLGDLSSMRKIVADTLDLVKAGNIKAAVQRITDYETAWDKNQAKLQKRDKATWTKLDEASDIALSSVRYPSATPEEMQRDLSSLIALLDNPNQ